MGAVDNNPHQAHDDEDRDGDDGNQNADGEDHYVGDADLEERLMEVVDMIHLALDIPVLGRIGYFQAEEVVDKSRKVLEVSVTHVVADDDVD